MVAPLASLSAEPRRRERKSEPRGRRRPRLRWNAKDRRLPQTDDPAILIIRGLRKRTSAAILQRSPPTVCWWHALLHYGEYLARSRELQPTAAQWDINAKTAQDAA